MTQTTPKPQRQTRKRQPKTEKPIQTEKDKEYIGNTEKYRHPENMVPLEKANHLVKDRIGKTKAVRGPGTPVTRVGLGGLKVIHQNPIDYHGNIDV